MPLLRTLALLGVLVASLCAQTTFVTPAKPGAPEAAVKGTFEISRAGEEAVLVWKLPEGEARMVEIYRNDAVSTKGRIRVGSVRVDVTVFHDTLPDGRTYWYWIKATRPNGVVVNVGPVAAPSDQVSPPSS